MLKTRASGVKNGRENKHNALNVHTELSLGLGDELREGIVVIRAQKEDLVHLGAELIGAGRNVMVDERFASHREQRLGNVQTQRSEARAASGASHEDDRGEELVLHIGR